MVKGMIQSKTNQPNKKQQKKHKTKPKRLGEKPSSTLLLTLNKLVYLHASVFLPIKWVDLNISIIQFLN